MKKVFGYFLQGLLYLVPVVVTVYVIVKCITWLDSFFRGVPVIGGIPGTGVIIILVCITATGYFLPKLITPKIAALFDRFMTKTPVIKLIYTSVRDLMKAFVGEKKKFTKPVIVSMDNEGVCHRLGYVTQDDLTQLGLPGMVTIYTPFSYSMMGDLLVVPKDKVKPIDINSTDLMKLVVSGGVAIKDEDEQQTHNAR